MAEKTCKGIASFQIQGNTFRVTLSLNYSKRINVLGVRNDFLGFLLEAPTKLEKCKMKVLDLERREDPDDYEEGKRRGWRNKYGWDGKQFLGADNIWSFSNSGGREKPEKYEDYVKEVYENWKKENNKEKK